MPVYDCGDPDCHECNVAFGHDRSKAIAAALAREAAYELLERKRMDAQDILAEQQAMGDVT